MNKEELRKQVIGPFESLEEFKSVGERLIALGEEVSSHHRTYGSIASVEKSYYTTCYNYDDSRGKWGDYVNYPKFTLSPSEFLAQYPVKRALGDYSIEELEAHIKERKNNQKQVWWVNVYPGKAASIHSSEENANHWTDPTRIRCVRIEV